MTAEKFDEYEKALKKKSIEISGGARRITIGGKLIQVSGSFEMTDDVLSVSGSASVKGPIELRGVDVSGSFVCEGDLTTDFIDVSGSCRINGNVKCNVLDVSGSCSISGDTECGKIDVSGSMKVGGKILGKNIEASGSFRSGPVVSEEISLSGAYHIDGDLKADNIKLETYGDSKINGDIIGKRIKIIGGEEVMIKIFFIKIVKLRRRVKRLSVNRIIGEDIEMEYVTCNEVRGARVNIGDECIVNGNIYYVENVSLSPSAKVSGKTIKVEKV